VMIAYFPRGDICPSVRRTQDEDNVLYTILRFVLIIFSCQGLCCCLAILVSCVREIQCPYLF
jgi:hypothetical protein